MVKCLAEHIKTVHKREELAHTCQMWARYAISLLFTV